MNDDLKNKSDDLKNKTDDFQNKSDALRENSADSFDALLREALRECVHGQPRPGLDRRILASLPARRAPMRWLLWPSLAMASVVLVAAVSLHLTRPNALPQAAQPVSQALAAATVPAAPPLAFSSVAAPSGATRQVQARHAPGQSSATGFTAAAVSNASHEIVSPAQEASASPQQYIPAAAETDVSAQTPNPDDAANSGIEIKPIHIAAIVIPPLPGPDAETQPIQPIQPIRIDPIKIAPIQIATLENDSTKPNR